MLRESGSVCMYMLLWERDWTGRNIYKLDDEEQEQNQAT